MIGCIAACLLSASNFTGLLQLGAFIQASWRFD